MGNWKLIILLSIAGLMFTLGFLFAQEMAMQKAGDYTKMVLIDYCGEDFYARNLPKIENRSFDLVIPNITQRWMVSYE